LCLSKNLPATLLHSKTASDTSIHFNNLSFAFNSKIYLNFLVSLFDVGWGMNVFSPQVLVTKKTSSTLHINARPSGTLAD
jgi:hypothetical protein